jgi:hypothetical protein
VRGELKYPLEASETENLDDCVVWGRDEGRLKSGVVKGSRMWPSGERDEPVFGRLSVPNAWDRCLCVVLVLSAIGQGGGWR